MKQYKVDIQYFGEDSEWLYIFAHNLSHAYDRVAEIMYGIEFEAIQITETEKQAEKVRYGSIGTHAYYDSENDAYYNDFGQRLRDPSEYDQYSEGYTPFGDE